MRDFDPVDNQTYKVNMKRLIDSVDKLTDELRKLTESVHNLVNAVGTPEPEFSEEYITLLKEGNNDEEIVSTWVNALFPDSTGNGKR